MKPAYYNEINPFAAQTLRNLIVAGHIAPGDVDERNILDVHPDDLRPYGQCHWFAGIGVWSYALRRAGVPDDYPIWTGSCPCQPFSSAGARAGFADERHLWPAFHYLIGERRPPAVLGEQVASDDVGPWIDLVQADMEALDYPFAALAFPSSGVGAPHARERSFWVANAHGLIGQEGRAIGDGRDDSCAPAGFGPGGGSIFIGMDYAVSDGRRARGQRDHAGDVRIQLDAAGQGQPLGLAHAERVDGQCQAATADHIGPQVHRSADRAGGCGGALVRLAHADNDGSQPAPGAEFHDAEPDDQPRGVFAAGESAPGPVNGLWADADWLFCRDEKWRPVEPGTFPLAHGLAVSMAKLLPGVRRLAEVAGLDGKSLARAKSHRVGSLRAYGNAINAEAAIAFIRSIPNLTPQQEPQ